jgi:hypothetical protein
MQTFLNHGWGEFGEEIFQTWAEYNDRFFKGKLKPIAIVPTPLLPYGHCVGLTEGTKNMMLAAPSTHHKKELRADRGTLLHEMIHQYLFENGHDAKHAGKPWCDCVMLLHKTVTGDALFCAPDKVGKLKGTNKSYRFKPTCEETGVESLPQKDIARWPHSVGLKLGAFGDPKRKPNRRPKKCAPRNAALHAGALDLAMRRSC